MKAFRQLSERPLRLPRLKAYVPSFDDPNIYWFNSERAEIIDETARRVAELHAASSESLELVLNNAAMQESARLEGQKDAEASENLGYWRSLSRRIARMSDHEKREALGTIASSFAKDIAGNFDPRVYALSKHVVPRLLTGIMQPSRLPLALRPTSRGGGERVVDRLLQVEGDIDILKNLEREGSLVYVPTHSSNLDSIVLGRALELCNLSPVVYGAGKNLFTNPIISFFMHNLGAYRVDRRIHATVYKDSLKTYSQVLVERGYHSLFFPGGTRSRSNLIESRVKLGLAGAAVSAFTNNQVRGVPRRVFFVPVTINYDLVLEAETLIEDWLKREGRDRYVIDDYDDEFGQIDRWISFLRKLVSQDSACVLRFGQPIDPFGNTVTPEGTSIGPSGHEIDPRSYVSIRGEATRDAGRDAAYTQDLGELLVARYPKETVVMATALVAHVLYRRVVRHTPRVDLFTRLRHRGEVVVPRGELTRDIAETRDRLMKLEREGALRVSQTVRRADPEQLLTRALDVWNGYHDRTAAEDRGNEVCAEDPTLLLYYQNRLVGWAVELAGEADREAAHEISALGGWS